MTSSVRATVATLMVLGAALLHANRASAEEPDGMQAVRDESKMTHGMAEFSVGVLSLPRAEVCTEKQAGCARGDTSLALGGWPLFRRGHFAAGAGLTMGITSSTDAPRQDPPDTPRDHFRRYLAIEGTARYYLPLTERYDGWVGITAGLGVVNDTFESKQGPQDQAFVGPRGATILTEGLTLGLGAGLAYAIPQNWRLGGGVRVSNWFLPQTPAKDPLGDLASLTGRITVLDLSLTIAYRTRLVL
jgi:hypothetical protein